MRRKRNASAPAHFAGGSLDRGHRTADPDGFSAGAGAVVRWFEPDLPVQNPYRAGRKGAEAGRDGPRRAGTHPADSTSTTDAMRNTSMRTMPGPSSSGTNCTGPSCKIRIGNSQTMALSRTLAPSASSAWRFMNESEISAKRPNRGSAFGRGWSIAWCPRDRSVTRPIDCGIDQGFALAVSPVKLEPPDFFIRCPQQGKSAESRTFPAPFFAPSVS